MLNKYICLFALCLQVSFVASAQSFDATKLSLAWEVIETSYQDKNQILAALTLTNNSKETFPSTGWAIYFNSGRQVSDEYGQVKMEFLNGDLNRITPLVNFQPLLPGKSLRIEYVATGKAINLNDVPSGFYLVWDDSPANGKLIGNPSVKPLAAHDLKRHITAEEVYSRNSSIMDIPAEELVKVFPSPVAYIRTSGAFNLTAKVSISADEAFTNEAGILAAGLKHVFGAQPSVSAGAKEQGVILKKESGLEKEAYRLVVTPGAITISATDPAGAFYGVQSLLTLLPPEAWAGRQKSVAVSAVEVSDAPRFGYRGFMLDVARNFQPKEQVLKVLDLMALYKLNVLHFHLNDDEGWRLEIPALPELTGVGGKRGHTLNSKQHLPASYGSGPTAEGTPGTGHYSKAEFIEILQYATSRHIRVIPEIETPGHARAAIRAMDARYDRLMKEGNKVAAEQYMLRDVDDHSTYRSVQKWDDNVMNVALPSTYAFIEKVVDEIREMYTEAGAPLLTVHLGGDEVPAGVWEKSPAVQAFLNSNSKVKAVDDLWYYYFGKVSSMLQAKGLYLSGWEEVALRKTQLNGKTRYIPNPAFDNENFHAYVWNNVWGWGSEDLAYRLANAGYKTILAPATNFYFDMAHVQDFEELGTYWASISDLDDPFSFVPFDYYKTAKDPQGQPIKRAFFANKDGLTEYGKSNIVGLQCLIWTETIRTPKQLEYMLTPRMLAFAERAWAKEPAWAMETDTAKATSLYNADWSRFVNVVGKRELPRLASFSGGFQYRIPTAGARLDNGKVHANTQLPGFMIRYTTNGSDPTAKSKRYTAPISEKGIITLKVFDTKGRGGKAVQVRNN